MLDRTIQPAIRNLERFEIQRPECIVMPNGIPVYILDAGSTDVVRIDVVMGGGRWHQSQPLQALFTNRMLREGSASYTGAAIAEQLDYYGAWLDLSSAPMNTYVSLYSLNKYLPQTLPLLASIVTEPVFPEKELALVVENNIQSFLNNCSKVGFLAHRALVKAVYGALHPCGKIVQEEDYRKITPDVLRAFYNKYYSSENCVVYISGRVTDAGLQQLEKAMGERTFGHEFQKPSLPVFNPSPCTDKRVFVEHTTAMQSAVRMGMLWPDRNHPDFLKLRVLLTLFGGYFGSRLMSNIREDKGYAYNISASILSYPDTGLMVISADTANEYVEDLISEVYREMDCLRQTDVSEQELDMVKNYMLGDFCRSYESAFSLADAWILLHEAGLPQDYYIASLDAIRSITPAEMRRLSEEYFDSTKLKETVVGRKIS